MDRLVFLLNPGAVPGAETGVWIMQADGTERRRLGGYGRPWWSPGGHQFLIISFANPRDVTLIDDRPNARSGPVHIADHKIFAMASWAGDHTIAAVIGAEAGEAIALVDVTNPEESTIQKVLWKKKDESDLRPNYPIYSPATGRLVFVGAEDKGMALYTLTQGQPGPPRRLEPDVFDKQISNVTYSPDHRFIVFSSNRPDRPKK